MTFLLFHLSHNLIAQHKYTLTFTLNSSFTQSSTTGFKTQNISAFNQKSFFSKLILLAHYFISCYFCQNLLFNIFSKILLEIFSTEIFHIFNFFLPNCATFKTLFVQTFNFSNFLKYFVHIFLLKNIFTTSYQIDISTDICYF